MTTATLSISRIHKNLQSKIDSVDFPEINWKSICFVGFFVGIALLCFYVWQINSLTKGSYLINSYDKKISQLSNENKNLEISFAESSFLGQALIKIQALDFQKTTSVKYIQISDNSTAFAEKK